MKILSSVIHYLLARRCSCVFVLILFSYAGQSQNKVVFQTVSSELDLGQIRPREIFEDSRGFIWTGTVDGLMKYDGYDNTIYRHQIKDSTSISESQIKWITEDEEGFFWIVNMNGNLNKFDPVNETFELIFTPQNTTESPQILNKVICQGPSLWLKMESGEVFLTSLQQPALDQIVAKNVNDFILNQDKLWVATETGLQYWANEDQKFVSPQFEETAEREVLNGAVGKLFIDHHANLWTISANHFYKINPLSYQVTTYPLVEKIPFLKESLFNYYYVVDKQDRLWFWRFGSPFELTSYHLLTKEIVRYPPSEETGLQSNAIRGALIDSRNIFWVATNNGLSYTNLEQTPFQVYVHQSSDATTISSNKIRRIVEDTKGRIWVATNGGGVN
ncbi:MAG: two-component regulator propeller domain-containing protein, partial [Bacteroidota bacterium]